MMMTSALCGPADLGFWISIAANIMMFIANGWLLRRISRTNYEAEQVLNEAHKFHMQAMVAKDTWKSAKLEARIDMKKDDYAAFLGATGKFPQGQLSDDDEGELCLGISYDDLNGIVRVDFGKPVAWLGLPPPQAIEFALLILKKAGAQHVEITWDRKK
jgi:hypothetical protein